MLMHAMGFDREVTLEQEQDGTFKVTYGHHVSIEDTLQDALAEFNNCVIHSATCAGMLD